MVSSSTLAAGRHRGRALIRSGILAITYYATGWVALRLAVPPIAAAPFWPAAGIALAGALAWGPRVVPGIVLASFLLNLPWNAESGISSSAVLVALATGCGAGLQAALAARWLAPRWLCDVPTSEHRLVAGILVSGPLACTINATIGIGALVALGRLPLADAPPFWLTWWIGDSIGVTMIAPLIVARRSLPSAAMRSVLWPQVIALPLVVIVFVWVRSVNEREQTTEASAVPARINERLRHDGAAYAEALDSLRRFMSVVHAPAENDFAAFVQDVLQRWPAVRAFEFARHIRSDQRAEFESRIGNEITQASGGALRPAATRDEYYAIERMYPRSPTAAVLGLDVSAEPIRAAAIARARDDGALTASGRIELLPSGTSGVLLVAPVFDGRPRTGSERRDSIRGVVLAVFDVEQVVRAALGSDAGSLRGYTFWDITDADRPTLLVDKPTSATASGRRVASRFEFGGRTWELRAVVVAPNAGSWSVWALLIGALALVALAGVFAYSVAARNAAMEAMVRERTEELSRSERELRHVLHTSMEAYVSIDEEGRVVAWNPGAERMLGWRADEIQGRELAETIIPPHLRDRHREGLARFRKTQEAQVLNQLLELEAHHRDGSALTVEVTIRASRVHGTWRFHAFMRDVTSKKSERRAMLDAVGDVALVLRDTHRATTRVLDALADRSPSPALLRAIANVHMDLARIADDRRVPLDEHLRWFVSQLPGAELVELSLEPVAVSTAHALACVIGLDALIEEIARAATATEPVRLRLMQTGTSSAALLVDSATSPPPSVVAELGFTVDAGPPLRVSFATSS